MTCGPGFQALEMICIVQAQCVAVLEERDEKRAQVDRTKLRIFQTDSCQSLHCLLFVTGVICHLVKISKVMALQSLQIFLSVYLCLFFFPQALSKKSKTTDALSF